MKTGIFGGTFDPVHIAHIAIAIEAVEQLELDKIIFIPAWTAPHKTDNLPAVNRALLRLEMLQLALADYDNFFVSDLEINRKGISYTYDTLVELTGTSGANAQSATQSNEEFFLLIGADNYLIFNKWRNFKKIHQLASVVVYKRPDSYLPEIVSPFLELNGKEYEITSTAIRDKISRGESIENFVPENVEKYILKNNLYKGIV